MYHFVWIPKYRKQVFKEPYRTALKNIIKHIAYEHSMKIEELEIVPDHVHLLIQADTTKGPDDIMRIIKSISAREFFKQYPEIRKKYFWGGKLWTQSYFVETIGIKNEKSIREYVKNQLKSENSVQENLSTETR